MAHRARCPTRESCTSTRLDGRGCFEARCTRTWGVLGGSAWSEVEEPLPLDPSGRLTCVCVLARASCSPCATVCASRRTLQSSACQGCVGGLGDASDGLLAAHAGIFVNRGSFNEITTIQGTTQSSLTAIIASMTGHILLLAKILTVGLPSPMNGILTTCGISVSRNSEPILWLFSRVLTGP